MRRLRIIVAEDQEAIRDYFVELLERQGHEVIAVADAASLASAYRDAAPDVVVTDWWLGDGDGLKAIAAAAGTDGVRRAPVVLVTGSDLGGLPDLTDAGVVSVLCKPIRSGDLTAAVERATAGRDARAAESTPGASSGGDPAAGS